MKPHLYKLKNAGIQFGVVVLVSVMALMLASSTQAAKMKKFNHVRFSIENPKGSWNYDCYELLANEAGKLSNGTLNVEIYPSSQLYKIPEVPTMLERGTLEIGQMNAAYLLGKKKKQWGRLAPTYLDDIDHAGRYYYMSEAGEAIIENDMIDLGMVNIGLIFLSSDWSIMSNKPIKTVADLKGIKMRMPGPFFNELVKAHGMVPVTIAISETHMALSRGTVDAVFTTPSAMVQFKFYEVTKYYNQLKGFLIGFTAVSVSKKFWDKLHPIQKRALLTAGYKASLYSYKRGTEDERNDIRIIFSHNKVDHTFSAEENDKFMNKIRPLVKPEMLDKFGGPDLAPLVLRSVEATRNMTETFEEASKIGYEKRLKRWGLD